MLRRCALLLITLSWMAGQRLPPTWKEFSMGPVQHRLRSPVSNIRQGELRAGSISLKSLVGIAAGLPAVRILGPDWLATEQYSVDATLSDESRLRLRTRSKDPVAEDFRSLLQQ